MPARSNCIIESEISGRRMPCQGIKHATIAIASTKTFCHVTLVMSFFKFIFSLLYLEIDTKSENHYPYK